MNNKQHMGHTLGTAAKATGMSRTAILRAIVKGKISAKKNANGEWDIDPAELHRVYEPVTERAPAPTQQQTGREIELLREMLTDRDRQIEGLNRRLEVVDEERRTTLRQLTAILTDQRAKPIITPPPAAMAPPASTKRRWRLFGGRG